MTRLNLNDACLLDASGELGPVARQRLHLHLAKKAGAQARFEAISSQFGLLTSLPKPLLPHADQARITSRIKSAIHDRLDCQTREKQALRRARLVHYALAGLSAAAAAVVILLGVSMVDAAAARTRTADNAAHLNRVIDRLATYDNPQAPYDQALADVDTSIRQLQAEGSSLSSGQTNEMTPLLDALASLPANPGVDGGVDELELPQGGF